MLSLSPLRDLEQIQAQGYAKLDNYFATGGQTDMSSNEFKSQKFDRNFPAFCREKSQEGSRNFQREHGKNTGRTKSLEHLARIEANNLELVIPRFER
ncbi:hypothetical protein L2E82_14667 [Cichorium intybus]|uniref:Uncharacterized protein n=1 Tax=Cichorium intybus TaxID=13427 RepID=A0ACB9F115_CICIN|nr:hypothetical protein L2E82_14667 [Cichorium intybus]